MMLLKSAAKRSHALRKGKRACSCCCDYGSTKHGAKNRQRARQTQRRVEARAWKADLS
jgi:hypothetical protein